MTLGAILANPWLAIGLFGAAWFALALLVVWGVCRFADRMEPPCVERPDLGPGSIVPVRRGVESNGPQRNGGRA